jgi:hypothetical protein|tara:strand:+ start:5027 stop:5362 length:336 start_codon:yes stop_codon:yes gene_type:complete
MPMKQTGRKVYKSMQGKQVDMDLLRQKNELTPAVGNAKVNARGDELGPGGTIVKTREQILADYQKEHPGVPDEIAVAKSKDSLEDENDVLVIGEEDEWEEDTDGNFVQKGN